MERLTNIDLSSEELSKITKENFFDLGGESIVLKAGDNKLYKIFNDCIIDKELKEMPQNKYRKIRLLHELNLDYMVKVLSTITSNGTLIGYSMSYDPSDVSLYDANISISKKIQALKLSKMVLNYFHSFNIIYGDIHATNILVNPKTGMIKFCDIDNIMIENYFFDLIGESLKNYINERRKIDETADSYMHNVTTIMSLLFGKDSKVNRSAIINMLYDESEADYIAYALNEKSTSHHNYSKIRKITSDMIKPGKFNGEYIISEL